MNKVIIQVGILVGSIVTISSVAFAAPIKNGQYQSKYPDNVGIKIDNKKFSIYYDDTAPDPAKLMPKGDFKYINAGTFYLNKNKKYYCLLGKAQLKAKGSARFNCSRSGWTKIN
jgi:catalase